MTRLPRLLLAALLTVPAAAWGGPPFDTDDPAPTDPGHWELYLGTSLDGRGGAFDGEAALEANYGPAPDLQLSLGLPLGYSHAPGAGTHAAPGDVELSVKYRFAKDEKAGWSVAAFPAVTLPTGGARFGNRHATATLPVWAQLDRGPWSLFGGGGYVIDPAPSHRNHWTAGVAALRAVGDRLSVGGEITREGAGETGRRATTGIGLGAIYRLKPPFSLLARAGPQFEDGGGRASYHAYAALGLNF